MVKKNIVLTAVFSLLVISGCSGVETPGFNERDVKAHTTGLPEGVSMEDGLLKFRGEVIHPWAFRDLQRTSTADSDPPIVAINLEEYWKKKKRVLEKPVIHDGGVETYEDSDSEKSFIRIPFFRYEYIGRVGDNIHVVKVSQCGGGTGIFISLLLVRFASERAYNNDGPYTRTVMTCAGEIYLGDRNYGSIDLEENGIRVGPHKGPSEFLSYQQEKFFQIKRDVLCP